MRTLRIGALGAARITPRALIEPASALPGVEVTAIAARDPTRAVAFAHEHGIPRAFGSYEELIAAPDVDAIYNALPNGLHGRWSIAAAAAGKHVLCEKPFAANADEAEQVTEVARDAGVVVMEAMHYRYHPLAERMREVAQSGVLGTVRYLEARMIVVVPRRDDIRYRLDLAGGAVMDVGCYAIHQVRTLAGAEPSVMSARSKVRSPGVDRWTRANLAFPDGRTGRVTCALLCGQAPIVDLRVRGDDGVMRVGFPNRPQMSRGIVVRGRNGSSREKVDGGSSFQRQLEAFAGAVLYGEPPLTPVQDAIANMRVIDAVYEAAGVGRREPS